LQVGSKSAANPHVMSITLTLKASQIKAVSAKQDFFGVADREGQGLSGDLKNKPQNPRITIFSLFDVLSIK